MLVFRGVSRTFPFPDFSTDFFDGSCEIDSKTCENSQMFWDVYLISTEPLKEPSYFPLYCLFHRDPCNGLLCSLYNWVV